MGTFLAFAFIFVVVCYGLGSRLGDYQQRKKKMEESISKGRVDYDYNGQYYVGNRRAYRLNVNGRDVLVDAKNTNNILYDITTREEGRLREQYIQEEQKAIDKAKAEGYDWFYIPNCERGTNESWMRKEIATGRLFKVREYQSPTSYWIIYYKLLNPIGTDRMNYVIDQSLPYEKISREEYLKRFYHIENKGKRYTKEDLNKIFGNK